MRVSCLISSTKMSGEDEKSQVASPEAEVPEAGAESNDKMEDAEEALENGDEKTVDSDKTVKGGKPGKRKAAVTKKSKEESEDDGEESDSEATTPKKKKPTPKKTPAKNAKKKEDSDDEDNAEEETKKSPKKTTPKKSKVEEESEEEEEDDEPPAPKAKTGTPLLDQPLTVTGSRERKSVSRFVPVFNKEDEKKKLEVPEGKGTPLGEMERIAHFISKTNGDDIKIVSKAMYGARVPAKAVIRKMIRKFNGYDFDAESEQWAKRKQLLTKLGMKQLTLIAKTLDLERKGPVAAIVERIMNFCLEPKDTGKKAPKKSHLKPRRKSGVRKTAKAQGKGKSSDDESGSDESGSDDESGEGDSSEGGDSSEEAEEGNKKTAKPSKKAVAQPKEVKKAPKKAPAKTPAKTPVKKAPAKKAPAKASAKKTAKAPAKTAAKKEPAEETEKESEKEVKEDPKSDAENNEEDGSSSDEEPLQKKVKTDPPTDEEIKAYVKKILDGANLEEVTMKTVCKQVYDNYPDHNIQHKRDLIKETVKTIIAS